MTELLTPRLTKYVPHEPTRQQALALIAHRFLDPAKPCELFYGGAAGGGKSDWLLMAGLQYVDDPSYAGIIFRRTYSDLALPGALMDRANDWLGASDGRWHDRDKTWSFPSGGSLTFGYLDNDNDRYRYQSAEFQFIGFDELTQFSERQYTYLFSRLRRTDDSEVPLRMCSASNPGGRGHGWVNRRLVEGRHPERVFVPAKVDDNPYLDKSAYVASLAHLPDTLRQQLLEGLWNAFEGIAYPYFADGVHVVPEFPLPSSFDRFGAMDFGTQNPCWLAFAVDYDGNVICFGLDDKPGMPSEQATRIKERSIEWAATDERGVPRSITWFAPPDIKGHIIRRDIQGNELRAEQEFNQYGFYFATAQNDRVAGYLRVAEMLKPDLERVFPAWHPKAGALGSPRAFILDSEEMQPLVENLREAPLEDPASPASKHPGEAVDGKWEHEAGHKHAAYRYGLMSRPAASEAPVAEPATPEELRADRVASRLERLEKRAQENLIDV